MTHHVAATAAAAAAGETARKVADVVANRWNTPPPLTHAWHSRSQSTHEEPTTSSKNIIIIVAVMTVPWSARRSPKTDAKKAKTRSGDRDNDEIKSGKSRALLSGSASGRGNGTTEAKKTNPATE